MAKLIESSRPRFLDNKTMFLNRKQQLSEALEDNSGMDGNDLVLFFFVVANIVLCQWYL